VNTLIRFSCCYLALLTADPSCGQQSAAPERSPHFNAREHQTRYVGPASPRASAAQVQEVLIGYFGPVQAMSNGAAQEVSEDPSWRAAQTAVARANAKGGFHGKPFRLVPAWSEDPWGTGVKQLTRLVYEQRVWAVIGGPDGPSTHLAEQVVAKARLALVSPVATDKTVNLANVPWMFSLSPGDHLVAAAMAPAITKHAQGQAYVVASSNDHDSHLLAVELGKKLDRQHVSPAFQWECESRSPNPDQLRAMVVKSLAAKPQVVVVLADSTLSHCLVTHYRDAGFRGIILGGPNMGRSDFLDKLTHESGPLAFPWLLDKRGKSVPPDFMPGQQLPTDADFAALQTFDAVCLTVAAIEKAGLDRVEIGRQLRALAPWQGVSGTVQWDGLGSNIRTVSMAHWGEGQLTLPWGESQ
jgi:ABC-type branched-subunit amino acid transport system substrate-binding protein